MKKMTACLVVLSHVILPAMGKSVRQHFFSIIVTVLAVLMSTAYGMTAAMTIVLGLIILVALGNPKTMEKIKETYRESLKTENRKNKTGN